MDQEPTQNQTAEQELQAAGGLPLTHDKLFREMFKSVDLARSFLKFVLPRAMWRNSTSTT